MTATRKTVLGASLGFIFGAIVAWASTVFYYAIHLSPAESVAVQWITHVVTVVDPQGAPRDDRMISKSVFNGVVGLSYILGAQPGKVRKERIRSQVEALAPKALVAVNEAERRFPDLTGVDGARQRLLCMIAANDPDMDASADCE